MPSNRTSRAILTVMCAAGLMAATVSAQTWDKKVYFTFSGPVEIPGATLQAGKYLFHLADPDSGRQVLQVQSADGKQVYGMFFSMPVQRPDIPDMPEVRFLEASAGSPPAISTMWYPGERTGRELIYPKAQAIRIAKATNASVLTTQSETTKSEEAKTGDLTRVSPSGQDTQFAENASPVAPAGRSMQGQSDAAPGTETPQVSTPVGTSGQTPAQNAAPARRSLPKTAGSTPLALLLGISFFGTAAVIRFLRFDL